MNFSEEVKAELINVKYRSDKDKRAFLSAYVRTAGSVGVRAGRVGFEISTDSRRIADYVSAVVKDLYGIDGEIKPTKKNRTTVVFIGETSEKALSDMGIISRDESGVSVKLGAEWSVVEEESEKVAYVRGAFLGGGSVTLPSSDGSTGTGYHLEFVFTNYRIATDFCEILSEEYFLPKLIERKDNYIVYMKTRDEISDLLALMQARLGVLKLAELAVEKDMKNNYNRQINCEVSNMTKQIDAAVKQIRAINRIEETVGLDRLPKEIRLVAEARVKYKNDTMSELSEKLGITKSCLNHRLRKIVELSEQI